MPTEKDRCIQLTLKHLLVRTALGVLRVLTVLKNGLRLFFVYGFGKPLLVLGRGLFRTLLVPSYKQYLKIRQRVKTHPRLAGIRSFGHFIERYAVYAVLIIFGVLALGNNIFARTIRPDEIGRNTIWATFSDSEASELIVETATSQGTKTNHLAALTVGGTAATNEAKRASNIGVDNGVIDTTLAVGGPITSIDSTDDTQRQETTTYTVTTGDTLSTIAHRFGLTSKTLVWANGMSDKDFIKPGQTLKIPPVEGYLYTVQKGDTLASIIKKYGGEQASVLDANHLASADAITPGIDIIIPGGEPPAPPVVAPTTTRRTVLTQVYGRSDDTPPPSAPSSKAKFVWPTSGHRMNQYFRGRYHTGIDIGGNSSSPIYAAAAGKVIYSAFDRSGYGLHIVIDHGNGYQTLYGHASKVFVSAGDRVTQGQTIAMVGSTGRSTGPHLHFEIRTGGGFLNPLSFF